MSDYMQKINELFNLNIKLMRDVPNQVWTSDTGCQCDVEEYKSEYGNILKRYIITEHNNLIIKSNSIQDSFILLCFLAQKENCKAPDIMQWLSDINSKEEYIERAKYIREKIQYEFPCSVAFEGDMVDIFNEELHTEFYGPTYMVREKEDCYEVYYDFYPERSNHRVQETKVIIYDKCLLYRYLLNSQFNLLLNRADAVATQQKYSIKNPLTDTDILMDFNCEELLVSKDNSFTICFNPNRSSTKTDTIANVYNVQEVFFSIPFPVIFINHMRIDLSYMWYWEVENGIRIAFCLEEIIRDDVWFEFCFLQKKYTKSGRAY